jgi:hypothetical protein
MHLHTAALALLFCAVAWGSMAGAAGAAPIAPRAAAPAYDAAFVSQAVPSLLELFAPTSVSITMRNTGSAAWVKSDGDVFLASQEPQDNYFWCIQDNPHGMYSGNRVLLPHDVAPGEDVTFAFVVKPLACGFSATPPFRFRMLSQMHGTFGDETPDPGIVLSTAAEFVSQQAPATAPAGATLRVSVTFRNTTNATWSPADGYALKSAGPAGNVTWGISSVALPAAVGPGEAATFAFSIEVPQTPATYNFQWQMSGPDGAPFGQVSPATPIEVVAAGAANYGGLWWASPAGAEAGWGINLAHQGDVIFATWFTYDASGKGLWLAMTATKTPDDRYAGTLLQTTGPAFDVVPFQPERVRTFAVGTGTLTFGTDDGTFAYTLNGVSQTKSITREVFGPLPTCTFDLVSDLSVAYNFQDLWWASPAESEPGWGINLTHQGDTIFATWFTYDHDGSPLWLSFTAQKTADGVYGGTLYRTTGPAFDSVPFDPARVVATSVGTASLTFTDGNTAEFSFSVDGISGTRSITREIFETPGTICQ